ncbi:hypothetical protein AMTR_s00092p00118300 [Amborella trichopoda]|uniref:Uncharacterized protein n=1 Tax=Amborella trichopoda TaxID=13333 RepID=W1NX28_AMBTC|nr:hypothetical protein AMTR_s00092p00118300 [Amborella trichopoda]
MFIAIQLHAVPNSHPFMVVLCSRTAVVAGYGKAREGTRRRPSKNSLKPQARGGRLGQQADLWR